MELGFETLGGCNYPDEIIKGVPRGFRVKFFHYWGKKDSFQAIQKVANSKKFPTVASHLAPFDYKHIYPIKDVLPTAIKNAKRYEVLAKQTGLKISLSICCEHQHPAQTMEAAFEDIHKVAPSCSLFNSIYGKGQVINGIITEIHLENSKPRAKPNGPYGIGFDGFGGDKSGNSSDCNIDLILSRYADAEYADIWCFSANGKFGWADGRAVEARDDYAYKEILAGHSALLLPREGGLTWPKTMLLKPFGDDHDQSDGAPGNKDNQFMCILPWAGNAEVLDSKNKVIAKLTRVTPDYNAGGLKGPRYYSMEKGKEFAYQLAALAVKNTGSNLVCIRVGKNKTPLTDARKRSGRF